MKKTSKKSKELVSVTVRLQEDLVKEIEEIAEALFSNRTAILQECLKLGLNAFKKARPEIMKIVKAQQ